MEDIGSDIYSRQWEEGGTYKEEGAWLIEQFKPGCERKSKTARFRRTDRRGIRPSSHRNLFLTVMAIFCFFAIFFSNFS